jgi:small-conductance mechanosensitive channel
MRLLIQNFVRDFLDRSTVPGAIVYAFVFAFLAWLLGSALRVAVQRALAHDKHAHFDLMAVKFLAKLARYGVYIFAFIAYARFVPVLSGFGAASLASISVMSLIMGFAAQNTLGNLIAGISLLLYRPFKLGDRLQVTAPTGLETGVVESLTLGYTLLKTDDNRRVVVPNSLMASQTAINLTANDPRVVCSVLVGISHESDIDKARAILLDALTAISLRCDLLEQAAKRFGSSGISVSSPRTTVELIEGGKLISSLQSPNLKP